MQLVKTQPILSPGIIIRYTIIENIEITYVQSGNIYSPTMASTPPTTATAATNSLIPPKPIAELSLLGVGLGFEVEGEVPPVAVALVPEDVGSAATVSTTGMVGNVTDLGVAVVSAGAGVTVRAGRVEFLQTSENSRGPLASVNKSEKDGITNYRGHLGRGWRLRAKGRSRQCTLCNLPIPERCFLCTSKESRCRSVSEESSLWDRF